MAIGALHAMLEPTRAMRDARQILHGFEPVSDARWTELQAGGPDVEDVVGAEWAAMIGAALAEDA